jgi:hypothetical protein
MNATRHLYNLGPSLWLDNITRAFLTRGTLGRYIREFAVTRLTSIPTIFEHADTARLESPFDYLELPVQLSVGRGAVQNLGSLNGRVGSRPAPGTTETQQILGYDHDLAI